MPDPGFQAVWEARAFALVMALHQRGEFEWAEFQSRLIATIGAAEAACPDEDSGEHYYERWLVALEALLADKGIVTSDALANRMIGVSTEQ